MGRFEQFWKLQGSNGPKKVGKMGIDYAGDIPNSLLADQDLEDSTTKNAIDTTTKELAEAEKDAKDAETTSEKDDVVDNIKAIQVKRQKAVLNAREKSTGAETFTNFWRKFK